LRISAAGPVNGWAFTAGQPVLAVLISRQDLRSIVLVLLAATLASLLSRLHRRVVLPTVVVEIVLGIVIGPQALGIADVNSHLELLSNFGLAFLFFVAGLEVVEKKVARELLSLGTIGWIISLAIALVVGLLLQQAGVGAEWWVLGIALCTTALGVLVPILSDAGLLPRPFGSAVLATGIAGEFWPIIFISVFLTGAYGALVEILLLLAFGAVVFLAATVVLSARPPAVVRVLQETVNTSGQTAVRASMCLLTALVLLSRDAGFDFVLGAFAAGLVVGLALDSPEGEAVRLRLEGIGFGFLIPTYFVTTGMTFDLKGFLTPTGLGFALLFLALFLVIRGASALLWARTLPTREVVGLALCGATGLPLIVAIVGITADRGAIASDVGASLIGAGMASVLLYPLLTTLLVRPRGFAGDSEELAAPLSRWAQEGGPAGPTPR
jgi:Kef-type K+ transport system membrane component KefB